MVLLISVLFFSVASMFMMSYLAMNTQLGPWIAPLFGVMMTMLAIPVVPRRLFSEYAILIIAAGSVAGMVGICLGMTIPSFYFLQKEQFLILFAKPLEFSAIISVFVLLAGAFSFVLAYFIKNHLIEEKKLPFPMAGLIYDIISIDPKSTISSGHRMMLSGVGIVSIWNIITMMTRTFLQSFHMHMIPLMLSVGFVAGRWITIPVSVGLATRIAAFKFLHSQFFSSMQAKEFLITFCSGMLLALFVRVLLQTINMHYQNKIFIPKSTKDLIKNRQLLMFCLGVLLVSAAWLNFCGVKLDILIYLMPLLIIICWNVARILGEIGVVELDSFVWFIILPLVYGVIKISSINVLILALFSMLCLGMVIDLIFSYKLAYLAKISYQRILRYQLLGFFVTVTISGFVIWWYFDIFGFDSVRLHAPKAHELEDLVQFGAYNSKVLLCGIIWAIFLQFFCKDLLAIIGATLMIPAMSSWLIAAGILSFLVKKPEKFYPLWFGVYSGHVFWIVVRSIMY